MANRSVNTSLFNIFEYWKDKAITRKGEVVLCKDATLDDIDVVKDWGEPMCWACSKPIIGNYERKLTPQDYDNLDYKKLYGDAKLKSKLNRCHIKPNQFGGEDTASNLFLMCPGCHSESPDTNNREAFMRWVYKQRKTHEMGDLKPDELWKLVDKELKDRELPTIMEMIMTCPSMGTNEFKDSKEFMRDNCGTHGSVAKISSRVIALADYFEAKYKEAVESEHSIGIAA